MLKRNKTITYVIAALAIGLTVGMAINPTESTKEEVIKGDTSEEIFLSLIEPIDCTESNKLSNKYSCNNLLDWDYYFWSDNGNFCNNQWVEFNFGEETYIEFIVLQNLERSPEFKANYRIKDLEIYTDSRDEYPIRKTLEDDNFEQWLDVNQNLTYLRIQMLNGYSSIKVEDGDPTNYCALQEVRFYGYENYNRILTNVR